MDIVKKLIINSPHDLFNILRDKIYPIDKVTHFRGIMFLYTNGCPCDAQKHWDRLLEVYRTFGESDLTLIKKDNDCSIIQFFEDGNLLFES